MSAMNIMGTYSGIDMATVEQLIQAESARGVRFTQQKQKYQQEQTAWKDVNGRLDNLYNRLEEMTKSETFNSKVVNNDNDEFISVTAKENAAVGEYRVQVNQLATATRLTGNKVNIASIEDSLNTSGTLTINNGNENISFNITSEQSLKDIRDIINKSSEDNKIKANIVDNRLILSQTELGDKSLIVSGDILDSLGLTGTTAVQGQQAIFEIDGLRIERDSNTIDDAIEGVAFTLKNVHDGPQSDTITISEDIEKAADAMKNLVDQYNSLNSFIKQQTSVGDPSIENNQTGILLGDSALTRLQSNLRGLFTRNMDTSSQSVKGLQDLGVEIDRYGVATFDRTEFTKTMKNNPEDVSAFFHSSERVTETNQAGEQETVTKLTGFANVTRSLVNEYISSTTGIIKTKSDTYDRLIKDVNQRIETFNTRIETKRQQYIKQFTALDTAMMQAESQLQFMMGQLGGTENG
ncbi:flagellar filament capping protein FliD [Marinilactibacillus psychrotolerans]|uniref:flagellar filament capping protein FliD n=1 Tax=Marinilactibacillus psychrotolerans TaxID=191770 RepID=UPI003889A3D2